MQLRKRRHRRHRGAIGHRAHSPRSFRAGHAFRTRAYENRALPIGHGQTLSQPQVVAVMTQALEIASRRTKVLEIGTGSWLSGG